MMAFSLPFLPTDLEAKLKLTVRLIPHRHTHVATLPVYFIMTRTLSIGSHKKHALSPDPHYFVQGIQGVGQGSLPKAAGGLQAAYIS